MPYPREIQREQTHQCRREYITGPFVQRPGDAIGDAGPQATEDRAQRQRQEEGTERGQSRLLHLRHVANRGQSRREVPRRGSAGRGQSLLDTDRTGAESLFSAAEPLLVAGYEGLEKAEPTIPPEARPNLREALERLVHLYTAWDKPAEAAKWRATLVATK